MIESMVVVAIMGAMSLAMAPSLGRMLMENRQHRAAVEVMLAARNARVEALFGGYASALYFEQTANGAVITPVTGMTSRCSRGQLTQYIPAPAPRGWQLLVGSPPIAMANYTLGGQAIRATLRIGATEVNTGFLCWEARGNCWWGNTPWTGGVGETLMTINRFDAANNPVGTRREIVFPESCTARLR